MTDWRQLFAVYYKGKSALFLWQIRVPKRDTVASWFFLLGPLLVAPLSFYIIAPFGRFSWHKSKFTLNGT
jgi:hypothetical protein